MNDRLPAAYFFLRNVAPSSAVLAVASLAGLHIFGDQQIYRTVLDFWLIKYHVPPFLDAAGITSAIECERLGKETYLSNPCDPLGRPFVYPPPWKVAVAFPLAHPEWTGMLAWLFIGAFLASLFFLPKAENPKQAAFLTLAMVSPPVGWVITSGNNDMMIFALAAAGLSIFGRSNFKRYCAYVIFLLAGMLKYFPVVLIGFALRFGRGEVLSVFLASALALLGTVAIWPEQYALAFANVWNVSAFTYSYGAENIAAALAMIGLFDRDDADWIKWVVAAGVVLLAIRLSVKAPFDQITEVLSQRENTFFVGGSLLITLSYLLTQNISYRLTLMLLLLPGLLKMAAHYRCSAMPRFLPWLCLFVMFTFMLRYNFGVIGSEGSPWFTVVHIFTIYAREVAWLLIATHLLAIVFADMRRWQGVNELAHYLPTAVREKLNLEPARDDGSPLR